MGQKQSERQCDQDRGVISFRVAIVAYVLVAGFVIAEALYPEMEQLPLLAQDYLDWYTRQPHTTFSSVAGWIALIASTVSIISATAMMFFAAWARLIFCGAMAALVISELLVDLPVLKTSSEYAGDSLLGLLGGIVLAMSFYVGQYSRLADKG